MIVFWTLVGVFLVLLGEFFVPVFRDLFRGSKIFLIPSVLFSLLGIILLVLILKEKTGGKLKKFLVLTGASATGFFLSSLLHNFISGLIQAEESFFFTLAIVVCPMGFLVGAIGSIVLFIKKQNRF